MEQHLQKSVGPNHRKSPQTKNVKDDNINNYALDSVLINMEGGLNTFEHLEDNSMFSPSKESDSDSGLKILVLVLILNSHKVQSVMRNIR
jgi:hypothetical protein